MPKGSKKCDPPSKANHMHHFDEALADALSKWNPGDPTDVSVTLEVVIAPNPGGVVEYIVNVGGGGQ